MYVAVLKEITLLASLDFSNLELCASVGEPTPDALVQRIEKTFNVTAFCGYGLTECLPGIAHSWEDLKGRMIKRGSCGRRLFDELKLVDHQGQESNSGELWIRNATVHRCYLDETLNNDKFTVDGWLKTGDLFYLDGDGSYFHKGRIDDMFIYNGKNIYPSEIEFALTKHPDINKVLAAPILNNEGGLIPAALIQTQVPLEEADVMGFFLKTGPLHAIPRFIRAVPSLPQLGLGKLDRNAGKQILQQLYDTTFERQMTRTLECIK